MKELSLCVILHTSYCQLLSHYMFTEFRIRTLTLDRGEFGY